MAHQRRRKESGSGLWIIVIVVVLVLVGGVGTAVVLLTRKSDRNQDQVEKNNGDHGKGNGGKGDQNKLPVPDQPQVTVFPKTKGRDPLTRSAALTQAISDLDRIDPGWRLEDMESKRPAVADDQNGAFFLYGAARLQPERWRTETGKMIPLSALAPFQKYQADQVKFTKAVLVDLQASLVAARKMRSYPNGRFRLDYKLNLVDTPMPHLQDLAAIRALLSYDAQLRMVDGDGEGAMDSCIALLHGCRYVADEPLYISYKTRIAVQTVAQGLVERAISVKNGPTDKQLEEVQKMMAEAGSERWFYNIMRNERAAYHYMLTNVSNGDVGVPGMTFSSDDHAWYLAFMNMAAAAGLQPPAQQATKLRDVRKLANQSPGGLKKVIPDVEKIHNESLHSIARFRAAAVGIALERYRRKNNRWPPQLSELVPAYIDKLPTDPYHGNQFRYTILPEGVAIYYNQSGTEVKDEMMFAWVNGSNDRGDQGFRVLAVERRE